jgi:hypothetical protein
MKKSSPAAYPRPADVKDLPPELAEAVLTPKQKRLDEKRRDEMMALHGTGARLSPEEASFNHARAGVELYSAELDRLNSLLRSRRRFPKGQRDQFRRALRVTALNLADSCVGAGEYAKAISLLEEYKGEPSKIQAVVDLVVALARPDNEHCGCPAVHQFTAQRVYDPARARFVDLVVCACGHKNATEQLPPQLAALHKARATAKTASDEAIIKLGEKNLAR